MLLLSRNEFSKGLKHSQETIQWKIELRKKKNHTRTHAPWTLIYVKTIALTPMDKKKLC